MRAVIGGRGLLTGVTTFIHVTVVHVTVIQVMVLAMLGCAAPAAAQNLVLEPVAEGLDGAAASGGARRRQRTKIHRPAEWRRTSAWPGRSIDGRAVSRFAATTAAARAELRGARPAGLCPAPFSSPATVACLRPTPRPCARPRPSAGTIPAECPSSASTPATWRKSTLPRSGFCWRSTGPAASTMAAPSLSAPMGFSISALATAAYRMASARRFSGRPSKFRRKP